MTSLATGLVLLSAFIHATWNIMARRSNAETGFISRMLPVLAIAGLLPALAGQVLTGAMHGQIWLYVVGSGVFCGVYFLCLGRAYESADFTTVYPVARALPVLLVAAGDAFRGHLPNGAGWAGMALVVCGCLMAPLRHPRELRPGAYFNRATIWIVLTALGTVGYSLLDKRSAELLSPGPVSALVYTYFFYFFTFIGYSLLARLWRQPLQSDGGPLWLPTVAGFLSFAGYFLVVWAYQLVERASYVVAFRQASLVIGVLMAFALYRQERHPWRLASVLVITAGLVVISVFG
ncbi:MAG: EamA family transporter [Anaerolineae bacterium]